ncbi:major facilitator superfamily domain-containing protein [Mucor mucedo]|uniref:major facilitator superfamily domain-containing protein n=1 Tax=Mucor mucedo TaxID=29922 RepID=UPI0022210E88|nr:major facilitator superfamily domain-containing protein [Mucor mucedo]KAI7888322.1 major facilitator superfamily domain-containing protein [Mucor mucedo]
MKFPSLKKEQEGPNSLTQMDNNEVGYGSTSQPQETRDFSQEFYGVQKVILMKRLGRKWDKILVVTGIIMVAWAKNWEGNVVYAASVAVTSYFESLNISGLISVVLYIVETVLLPMYAKFSDMIGRSEAFAIAIFFYVISGIVQAVAPSMDALIGGQVIYAIGISGVSVLGHVLIADITSSVNRGLFQAFYDFPAMVNLWVAPLVGDAIVKHSSWRWTYAMIPFCVGGTAIPLLFGLYRIEKTVKKSGLLPRKDKTKYQSMSFAEKFKYVCNELDIVGSILFIGALCMILLPLVLGPSRWGGWNTSPTIGCLVAGFVCAILFVVYERKYAEFPVIPVGDWKSPTPIAGVMTCAAISTIRATNWTYFTTYLQITRRVSNVTSVYIDRSYHATFLLSQLAAGYLMKRFKVYRPIVFVGICLYMLGMGLMIPSRYPTSPMGFVIITQIIAGFGSGMIYVPVLVAVQSSVPHADLAMVTALVQVGGTIATSIGGSIAGAIWNALLPGQLAEHAPGEYDPALILGSIDYINNLPEAQHAGATIAYGHVQRILSIVGLCLSIIAFGFFLRMKPFGLTEEESHGQEPEGETNEQVADSYSISKSSEESPKNKL